MNNDPLDAVLSAYDSLLVGFSGGVDSALLAVVARRVLGKEKCVAAIGISPSLPEQQLQQAHQIGQQFDLNLLEVRTNELDDPGYVANAKDRCYFCKRELWMQLVECARNLGFAAVAEGTITDDLSEHRPGLAAAEEFRIVRPLADAGYSKEMVREQARRLGIPIWDAPAAPCLSSRLLYGLKVTPERLSQVEAGEKVLRGLGVSGDLRVRHRGDEARVEVMTSEFEKVRAGRQLIAEEFGNLGFTRVTLDLGGYRRGSLLGASEPELELLT